MGRAALGGPPPPARGRAGRAPRPPPGARARAKDGWGGRPALPTPPPNAAGPARKLPPAPKLGRARGSGSPSTGLRKPRALCISGSVILASLSPDPSPSARGCRPESEAHLDHADRPTSYNRSGTRCARARETTTLPAQKLGPHRASGTRRQGVRRPVSLALPSQAATRLRVGGVARDDTGHGAVRADEPDATKARGGTSLCHQGSVGGPSPRWGREVRQGHLQGLRPGSESRAWPHAGRVS